MANQKPIFLERLSTAEKKCGLHLFNQFLTPSEIEEAFPILNDDDKFPWNLKPTLFGSSLPQHSYHYSKSKSKNKKSSEGIQYLTDLCERIEREFDGKVSDVYCNRFQDPKHHIVWHKDTYGAHIFVLTLGSVRRVEFRENKTKEIESVSPNAGDLYFMPLSLNSTHMHRVCPDDDPQGGTRLSFVFFFEPPSYATDEFKISTKDKIKGGWDSFFS
mmetsp:Transcript_29903/g.41331  ORF Transcript_29903/g.41331 Transcript_29903/m.41331 type:complete len:216 (-) Transcript_29903:19-666(-)